jgi:hypothetical protein
MAYVITNGIAGIQPIATKSTTQNHPLGKIVTAKDPTYGEGEFIYLKGVASCALGTWVTYQNDGGVTTRATANAIGPLAIAMTSTTASYYGWFQINGMAIGKCLTLMASNTRVWLTGTAGSVDDTSVAGDGVNNARSAALTVVSSGVTEFDINRPWVNDKTSWVV